MVSTTRLGLFKPAGTDLVDRVADLNDNFDKIDAKVGRVVCTSSTRPTGANLYNGLPIYETDTGNFLTYDSVAALWKSEISFVSGGTGKILLGPNVELGYGAVLTSTSVNGDINVITTLMAAHSWAQVFGFQAMNSDYASRPNIVFGQNNITFPSTTGFMRVYVGNTGAAMVSLAFRFAWIAFGK